MIKEICRFYLIQNIIYCYVSLKSGRENRIRFNTGLKFQDKEFWDTKKGTVNSKHTDFNSYEIKLRSIKAIVNVVADDLKSRNNFNEILLPQLKTEFIRLYNDLSNNSQKTKFFSAFDSYLQSKENSVRSGTLQKFKRVKFLLLDYQYATGDTITFDSVDKIFKDKFGSYLFQLGQSDNYTAKLFGFIRSFMNWCYDREIHHSLKYKYLKKSTTRADIVVLTQSELDQLYSFEFDNERLTKTRDMFIFQTELCQRHSDIKEFNKNQFYVDADGDNMISVRQMKTDTIVQIPVSPRALEILNKYSFVLPSLSNQRYNEYLKEACKIAGIDSEELVTTLKGGKKTTQYFKKYELVSSHTARRSGASLLVEKGVPIPFVMQMTGHKSISEFQKYIKISPKLLKSAMKHIWGI